MTYPLNDVLALAAAHIEAGWTTGNYALNHQGWAVATHAKDACQWCLMGALMACQYELGLGVIPAVGALKPHLKGEWIPTFNDRQTSPDAILALISEAVIDGE